MIPQFSEKKSLCESERNQTCLSLHMKYIYLYCVRSNRIYAQHSFGLNLLNLYPSFYLPSTLAILAGILIKCFIYLNQYQYSGVYLNKRKRLKTFEIIILNNFTNTPKHLYDCVRCMLLYLCYGKRCVS